MLPYEFPVQSKLDPPSTAPAPAHTPVGTAADSLPRIGLSGWQRWSKRAFDVIVSLLLLGMFGWLLALIAVGVRLTTGRPVIFGHVRIGRGGRPFRCLKFRSMVPDAHAVLQDLLANDAEAMAEWTRDFKLKNDPRITPFGRFLRRTSLDELPQLWNVLRGDMSLVGPRPVVQEELLQHYLSAYAHYICMRPGMSGLWQVSGRNNMSYAKRVELDRSYVERWSLWLDLRILAVTAFAMIGRHGAY